MKNIILAMLTLFILAACGQSGNDTQQLQAQVDSLQDQLAHTYRPGLGEFMSGIQVHHVKLWFAGEAQNWKLADFEMGEIREAFDGIKQYNTDRPEIVSIPMILPALDSMDNAIQKKDPKLFKSSFLLLTNTCNNCHHATRHEFNVIKVPNQPPFSDQAFKPQ